MEPSGAAASGPATDLASPLASTVCPRIPAASAAPSDSLTTAGRTADAGFRWENSSPPDRNFQITLSKRTSSGFGKLQGGAGEFGAALRAVDSTAPSGSDGLQNRG